MQTGLDSISHQCLLEDDENILERKDIIPTIKKRKTTYFGHIIRHNTIHRLILEGPQGEITRGGPRTQWVTNIKEWTGMRYDDVVRLAQDRERWSHERPPSQRRRQLMMMMMMMMMALTCALETALCLDGVVTQGRRTSAWLTLHLTVLTQAVVTHVLRGTKHLAVVVEHPEMFAPLALALGATLPWWALRRATDRGATFDGATIHGTLLRDGIRGISNCLFVNCNIKRQEFNHDYLTM